ncbi:MAG TPA: sigma 54-interacting transcriptional regulator [Firmicutes bacterium]|nr:sigma 54-interacting transcriptional regulator [Bacillota bacterium]
MPMALRKTVYGACTPGKNGVHGQVTFDSILGRSKAICEAKRLAQLAARGDSNVLLLGESGCGKEVFARAIHSESKRRHAPFVAVNCAAIPDTLMESELFGYVEGAFTGAVRTGKVGKFELACGGTIFLDEIGDYYVVGSADSKNPSFPLLTRTEVVRLKYVKAQNAMKLLSDFFVPYVKVGPDDNILVITASASMVERIRADLAKIDRPVPQVLLEALVMEISSESGKSFGADWRYEGSSGKTDSDVPASGFVDFVSGIWGVKYNVAGGLEHLIASMKTLIDSGRAQIHATPKLATLDGEPAEIFLGRDRYFTITTGSNSDTSTRLESIRTGISLRFTPRVSETGEITVKIEPEVSDAVEVADGLPLVNRRKVATSIRVKDGETIVIGGLKLKSDYETKTKVPLLGDLPVLGVLFSSTRKAAMEAETVIFITPRIMQPGV